MRAAYRHRSLGLIRRLVASPGGFEFHQALRLLEMQLAGTSAGEPAARLRFRNSVSLAYPVGDIESIRVFRDGNAIVDPEEALEALSASDTIVEVTQAFLGLLGTFGALPLASTEFITRGASGRRGNAARAFLDLLSHRAVSLFHEAWRYQHPALGYETMGESSLERIMKALAGRGLDDHDAKGEAGGLPIPDDNIAGVCAALRHRPMSAPYLSRVLSAGLGEAIRVEDFVGAWYDLPANLHARLGTANVSLGANAILGKRSWQRHLRIRLHVGPLRMDRYRAFLKDGGAAASLRKWLRATLGHGYEYEVVPLLHRDDISAIRLGGTDPACLGRDTFLTAGPAPQHRCDASYLLSL